MVGNPKPQTQTLSLTRTRTTVKGCSRVGGVTMKAFCSRCFCASICHDGARAVYCQRPERLVVGLSLWVGTWRFAICLSSM